MGRQPAAHLLRDIPVGNGNLLVAFDHAYRIRDIYYPYAGKANHARRCASRTGVWVDGKMSWVDEDDWAKQLGYAEGAIATQVSATHESFGIQLIFNDLVDFNRDVFLRKVSVLNLRQTTREVRLFFHYDFRLWDVGRGDSVQYDSHDRVLTAYKDDCYFLMNAASGDDVGITDWTTGQKGEQEFGTSWRDAEDGVLEKRNVAYGAIDCVLGTAPLHLEPGGDAVAYAWLAAGRSLEEVREHDAVVRERSPRYLLTRTLNYWQAWANKEDTDFRDLPQHISRHYQRSLLIMRTHVDNRGGIIAATDTDIFPVAHGLETYTYVWARDGAYIANAFDKAGYAYVATNFYEFCKRVLGGDPYRDMFADEACMLHKYTVDGLVASNWMPQVDDYGRPQRPIEEDETAIIPYMLWQHYLKYRNVEEMGQWFRPLVVLPANFMVGFREPHTGLPAASFDLWETEVGIYSYTVATVWAGLTAAANFADMFGELALATKFRSAAREIKDACERELYDEQTGRFLKRIVVAPDGAVQRDDTVDASLFGLWYFGMFEPTDPRIERTMRAIEEDLWARTLMGGIARYQGDPYYRDPSLGGDAALEEDGTPGNPWFVCTLWLAQYRIARATTREELGTALPLLEWATARAMPSGVMAEQIDPISGQPASVTPLIWSNATFVSAVQDYLEKFEHLTRGIDP